MVLFPLSDPAVLVVVVCREYDTLSSTIIISINNDNSTNHDYYIDSNQCKLAGVIPIFLLLNRANV